MATRFKTADEIPFLLQPGDLLEEGGTRFLVRFAQAKWVTTYHNCGCSSEAVDYLIYIDEPWHGPQPVIAEGGGCLLVMPVEEWWGDWPPTDGTRVLRDGKQVFPDPSGGAPPKTKRT